MPYPASAEFRRLRRHSLGTAWNDSNSCGPSAPPLQPSSCRALAANASLRPALEASQVEAAAWKDAAGGTIFGLRVEPEVAGGVSAVITFLATR